MKKIFVLIGVLAAMVLFSSVAMAADEMAGRGGLGLKLNYVSPKGDSFNDGHETLNINPNSGLSYEANATYFISQYFSMEAGVGYFKTDIDANINGGSDVKLLSGFKQVPLTLTARAHYPLGAFSPYVGLGVGYYFNSIGDLAIPMPGVTMDMDNSFGYHAVAGCEAFVSKNVAVDLSARYTWNKADLHVSYMGGEDSEKVKLDNWSVGLGLKYYF